MLARIDKCWREKVLDYIEIAKGEGARLVLGGTRACRIRIGSIWINGEAA